MSKFSTYEILPFIADLYDFIPGYHDRRDMDFSLDYASSANGKILELGCGTGRVLIPIARAGGHIVGLDLSEHMLAKCSQKLETEGSEV